MAHNRARSLKSAVAHINSIPHGKPSQHMAELLNGEEYSRDPPGGNIYETVRLDQSDRPVDGKRLPQLRANAPVDNGHIQAKKEYAVEAYFRDRRFSLVPNNP